MIKVAKKKKTGKTKEKIILDSVLPQNILPIGEHVEEDKNIYISQNVYKEIQNFTKNKTTNESGGMLIGNVIDALGKTNIIIQGFIEAKYCEATPTTLKFTHETWDYVNEKLEHRFDKGQIVGWIHTHPDFGIFLSEYDKFIQQNFFKEDYQIAYVVDPIQHIEGFYFWINGRIEKCKGFYIFDRTGEIIQIEREIEDNKEKSDRKSIKNSNITYFLLAIMAVVIIAFSIVCSNLLKRMEILETKQENLVESANMSIQSLQQRCSDLQLELDGLKEEITQLNKEDESNVEETTEQSGIADPDVDNDTTTEGTEENSEKENPKEDVDE